VYNIIQAIYDGNDFKPIQPVSLKESYSVYITFFEPMKVSLLSHDEDWAKQFKIIKEELNKILGENVFEIYHIGSTAIKNILSKPILDIAVVVKKIQSLNVIGMDIAGYNYFGEREPGRYLFAKHYQYGSISLQHIHCYEKDNERLKSQVLFCKYLNEYPESAKEYNDLKLELVSKYPNDRWSYSRGKSEFINKIIDLAKNKYCPE
jgi:GrpB-like predicted nucleotidyltransferase (UPF0157 family)